MPSTREKPVTDIVSRKLVAAPATRRIDEFPRRNASDQQTESVLLSLARVIEQRDSHTAGHCERLAFTGVALGVAMGLDHASLLTIYLGGYMHDVGKVGIPDAVLFKPGRLT